MGEIGFVSAVIAAAGNSTRMAGSRSKQFYRIGGKAVLVRTLEVFDASRWIGELVVSVRKKDGSAARELIQSVTLQKPVRLVEGGETRQESVRRALEAVSAEAEYIAVHDGARPLVTENVIEATIRAAADCGAAAAGVPVKDTIKQVDGKGVITATPDRSLLWSVQTPQVFRLSLYRGAMDQAQRDGRDYTDDCQLLESIGAEVRMVMGDYGNIKITTPEDIDLARGILEGRANNES